MAYSSVLASPYTIRGRVTTADGEALSYAYVRVEGKQYATQADKDGYYTLQLSLIHISEPTRPST